MERLVLKSLPYATHTHTHTHTHMYIKPYGGAGLVFPAFPIPSVKLQNWVLQIAGLVTDVDTALREARTIIFLV